MSFTSDHEIVEVAEVLHPLVVRDLMMRVGPGPSDCLFSYRYFWGIDPTQLEVFCHEGNGTNHV